MTFDREFAQSLIEATNVEEKTDNHNFLLTGTMQAILMGAQVKRLSILMFILAAIVLSFTTMNLYSLKKLKANKTAHTNPLPAE